MDNELKKLMMGGYGKIILRNRISSMAAELDRMRVPSLLHAALDEGSAPLSFRIPKGIIRGLLETLYASSLHY